MPILDSDVIIDYLKEKPVAVQTINDLLQSGTMLCTTAFSYFEVYFGAIAFEKNQSKIEKTEFFLESMNILFPTLESIKKSAQIQLELRKKGKIIDPVDIFIAGIAATFQETLYTQNTKHFSDISGLKIKPC